MERKIGEIFENNGEWYQCVEGTGCYQCAFNQDEVTCLADNPHCTSRSDRKDVIFKKLEKVGEPFTIVGTLCQRYKVFDIDNVCGDGFWCVHDYKAKTLTIEIKQTNEDMEEKNNGNTPLNVLTDKYVNGDICYDDFEKEVKALYSCKEEIKPTLKDFDLEEAKAGKPVYTRDGRKARIVCYDFKGGDYPIIALVECRGNREIFCAYSEKGEIGIGTKTDEDLMIAPELHEGWVNIYRDADTGRIWASQIYKTELAAMEFAPKAKGYITAVKIEWEE